MELPLAPPSLTWRAADAADAGELSRGAVWDARALSVESDRADVEVAAGEGEEMSAGEAEVGSGSDEPKRGVPIGSFEDVYEEHFDFVWRTVRRLGVPASSVDDAVQDVFVVVHRRAADFEGRSSVRTWLFGIVVHVAREHRRRRTFDAPLDPDTLVDPRAASPHAQAEAAEAKRVLFEILDRLDDERREVFVLIELSEMTAPEAAETLGIGLNTVYSRLRAARQLFDAEVQRRAARTGWRLP